MISNIAQYQNSEDADLNKTIKLVLTHTNQIFDVDSLDTQQVTQYFSTDYNQDVAPGGFLWLKDWVNPYRSPQIFGEYLTKEDVADALTPIDGFNHTTAIFKGTTIDNPAFGIKAGQKCEIMMISLNENVTTFVMGLRAIELTAYPLARMVFKLSADQELVRRVHNFFFGSDEVYVADEPDEENTTEAVSRGVKLDEEEKVDLDSEGTRLSSSEGRRLATSWSVGFASLLLAGLDALGLW